jgi:hypothetical protein
MGLTTRGSLPVLGMTVGLTIIASTGTSAWSQQGLPLLPPLQPQGHLKSNNVQEIPVAPTSAPTPESPSAILPPPHASQRVVPPPSGIGRPPPIQAQNGCELWRGTFSGNDPSVLVEVRLCTDSQGRVTGIVQWSSLKSGFNEREVAGIRDATGDLELHDLSFLQYHPKFLWKFCLIERYTLDSDGPDHLVGSYESQACSDNAQIDLSRIRPGPVRGQVPN